MSKFINIMTAATLIAFSAPIVAQGVNLSIGPHSTQVFENNYMWALNATCKIQCKDKNRIMVKVMKNTGRVNGRNLSSGQKTSLAVHNNDYITVSAEPGTKVNLLNLGTGPVLAKCSI